MRNLTTRQARAMARRRKTHAGGRPRSQEPRCPCGQYTAERAAIRHHKCQKDG